MKKNLSNHKESKRRGFKKTKEVICFKCKRPYHIKDECPKLKHKEAKERRRAFKATCDGSSESEMEEEQQEPSNLCFVAMEDAFEVPLLSNSSYDYSCDDMCDGELDDDEELDDNNSLIRKLFLKCQRLLLKKKVYKQKFSKLSNNFEDLKLVFSNVKSSNEKLTLDLKTSISLKVKFDKIKDENQMLSKEIFELKNSISKFHKGKKTLDNRLNSQTFSSEKFQLDFSNGTSISLSPRKSIKATLTSSSLPCEIFKAQDSKTNNLKNLNTSGKPLKANIPKAQDFKAKAKKPQPHYAFMYHNKKHTHMHDRPQKFMHDCDCKMHTY